MVLVHRPEYLLNSSASRSLRGNCASPSWRNPAQPIGVDVCELKSACGKLRSPARENVDVRSTHPHKQSRSIGVIWAEAQASRGQSDRNATLGSTLSARIAGIKDAPTATIPSTNGTPKKVIQST